MKNSTLINQANELARIFASMHGYEYPLDFKFYEHDNSITQRFWAMSCAAYDFIRGSDVEDALNDPDD